MTKIEKLKLENDELRQKLNTRPRIICNHVICEDCARKGLSPCEHVVCPNCAIEIGKQEEEYDSYMKQIWANEEIINKETNNG